ncbi:hypothetical protein COLO4_19843 [Corchorus olitorius]|uniref:PPIase cyclophilin-type domain-containing protein n=1 Tax=Corchorus olitorius TaxID=93759 RepID=A0A1R3J335_9ROSI|nr:hypothetical protein COLO4_19843 [Corchorus olitorius]
MAQCTKLPLNTETVDSKEFLLKHSRSGVVSLYLSEIDDDDEVELNSDYRNLEFLITTGPGPCPQLDNNNIVFGTVHEGIKVLGARPVLLSQTRTTLNIGEVKEDHLSEAIEGT